MGSHRVFLMWIGLSLMALMCVQFPTPAPKPSGDVVATSVAATLTAMAPGTGPGSPPAPTTPAPPSPIPPTTTAPEVRLHMVYTDGGLIMAQDAGGGMRRLGTADRVKKVLLTSDGTRVIFVRGTDDEYRRELWVINSDGTGERRLLSAEEIHALHPPEPGVQFALSQVVVVPGTHSLLFNTWVLHEGPGLILSQDLFYLDVDTGALTRLLDRGEAGYEFSLSPDGRWLALGYPDAIDVARLEGAALRDLRRRVFTFPVVLTYSEYSFIPEVIWQTGAEAFGVVLPPPDEMAPSPEPLRIWRVPMVGAPTLLGEFPGGRFGQLSPDLAWVVVYRTDPPILARSNGSDPRVIEARGIGYWSPNSRFFATFTETEPRALLIHRVDGPSVRIPLGGNEGKGFRWISEDTFYLWVGRRGSWRLVRGRVDGTLEDTLATSSDHFSPSYDVLP